MPIMLNDAFLLIKKSTFLGFFRQDACFFEAILSLSDVQTCGTTSEPIQNVYILTNKNV